MPPWTAGAAMESTRHAPAGRDGAAMERVELVLEEGHGAVEHSGDAVNADGVALFGPASLTLSWFSGSVHGGDIRGESMNGRAGPGGPVLFFFQKTISLSVVFGARQ